MKLSEIPKDELELMGYDDIALLVLQESGKKMKLNDIFKKVCNLLELPDSILEEHLVDFFELMSTNKKFIMVSTGNSNKLYGEKLNQCFGLISFI